MNFARRYRRSQLRSGLQWGPEPTTLRFENNSIDIDGSFLDDPSTTSIEFSNLITLDDGGNGNDFNCYLYNTIAAYSFPKLETAITRIDGSGGGISSWSSPRLKSISREFSLYSNPLTFLDISGLETVGGDADIVDDVPLVSASFPSLISVGAIFYAAYSCPNLVHLWTPSLTNCGSLWVFSNNVLPQILFPLLATISGNTIVANNPLLTSVSLPAWLPTNGTTIDFSYNALLAASVNHILARCIANPAFVSGTVDISLGTNAAPTGQGIIDTADLITRGVNVNTN